MSGLVGPNGAPVSSDPMAQDLTEAEARLRRSLAASMYGAGPLGTIVDERGKPLNRKPEKLAGLAAWLPTEAPSRGFAAYYGPREHINECALHPRHEGRCSMRPAEVR
jgi:hypothetical protein